jgi:RNA polymerase sigma-70 factor, ECF subfamily
VPEDDAVIAMTLAGPRPVLTDEQLLARYARGERAALDELFRRHRTSAYRVAYRRLGREADALDAVQEGFFRAFRHLGGFRRRSSFKTWLLRVIGNAAIDLRRQRARRRSLGLESGRGPAGADEPAAPADPARRLEEAELRRRLDEALAALPEPHRRTFLLHAHGERSYREVAAALGVPIGTVMSRLHYARRKLQARLFPAG